MQSTKNNIFNKLFIWIKNHKIISIIIGVIVALIIIGVIVFSIYKIKYAGTEKAFKYAEKGYLTAEEMEDVKNNGGVVFGEELVDENGDTYVLTQDENGNIVSTKVKNSDGTSTGATVPENHTNPTNPDTPQPHQHTHVWVNHYTTQTIPCGSHYVVDSPAQYKLVSHTYCNTCGACVDGIGHHEHGCNNGHYSTSTDTKNELVSPEVGHWVTDYTTQQVVDYIYCSECGAHQ